MKNQLYALQKTIGETARKNGFHGSINFGEKIALCHAELSEALEAYRLKTQAQDEHCPEFLNVEVELADCIIRILDIAAIFSFDVVGAIFAKAQYNTTRPHKHNKRF